MIDLKALRARSLPLLAGQDKVKALCSFKVMRQPNFIYMYIDVFVSMNYKYLNSNSFNFGPRRLKRVKDFKKIIVEFTEKFRNIIRINIKIISYGPKTRFHNLYRS